jgi:hypothetical protein
MGPENVNLASELAGTTPTPPSTLSAPNAGSSAAGYGMIAEGVGQTVGGIIDITSGQKMFKEGKAELNQANANLQKLMNSQPSLSTPSEYFDAVKNAYDQRLVQMRTEDINRSLATTAQSAQQFGARGLGATLAASSQAQRQQRQLALDQQQQQTQALTNLAGARERERDIRERRSTRDIDYGFDAKAAAEAKKEMGRQQRNEGIVSAITGPAQIAAGVMTAGLPMAKGGAVQKTPGAYSHKTNELPVVDKNGNETGVYLTGGEYVFNPQDSKKMFKMAKNDKSKLGRFVLGRLKKFEKELKDFENG